MQYYPHHPKISKLSRGKSVDYGLMKAMEALFQCVLLSFEDSHCSLNSRLKAFFIFLRICHQFSKILFGNQALFFEPSESRGITIQSFLLLVIFPSH